jgi:hypothetical protein
MRVYLGGDTAHDLNTMNIKVKQNMTNGKKEGSGKEPKRGSGGNIVRSVERIIYAIIVGK